MGFKEYLKREQGIRRGIAKRYLDELIDDDEWYGENKGKLVIVQGFPKKYIVFGGYDEVHEQNNLFNKSTSIMSPIKRDFDVGAKDLIDKMFKRSKIIKDRKKEFEKEIKDADAYFQELLGNDNWYELHREEYIAVSAHPKAYVTAQNELGLKSQENYKKLGTFLLTIVHRDEKERRRLYKSPLIRRETSVERERLSVQI